MSSENAMTNDLPITLVVLSGTRVEGEKLLSKIDETPFARSYVTNIAVAVDEIDAELQSHIVLIDHGLSDGRVQELVTVLRQKYPPSRLLMLGLIKKEEITLLPSLIQSGIFDFETSPVTADVLNSRLLFSRVTLRREHELSQTLNQDFLTGLPNRQRFLDQAVSLYASAHRNQKSIVAAMIAPDHLATINNEFGLSIGDYILKTMANLLARRKRDTDLLCRFDGSRFCLLTVDMQDTHLITFLDDVLASFQAHDFGDEAICPTLTASIGATKYLGENITDMFDHAERALFQARENGYNQFVIMEEQEVKPVPTWSVLN
ncbi:MAG: GGDEF domain-containing protein [Sneathiella sp.]|nr:GGDEF domain-containing protein [Sneathiella sp.]